MIKLYLNITAMKIQVTITTFNRAAFMYRESNCFALLRSGIGLKKTRATYSTNRDLITRVFPRLAPVARICFEFSLVRFVRQTQGKKLAARWYQFSRGHILIWFGKLPAPVTDLFDCDTFSAPLIGFDILLFQFQEGNNF